MAEVYLSPSVRHFNRGYGTYGTEEQRANLIADVVQLELVRNGLTVDRNRPEQDLAGVVADANARQSDVYVAIRSVGGDPGERGATVYYYRPGTNGERLASDIYEALAQIVPEGLGIQEGAGAYGGLGFYELRETRSPSVIVQVGYHSDPQEADFIIRNVYEIGTAIAKGVLAYFGLSYTENTPEEAERLKNEYNNVYLE